MDNISVLGLIFIGTNFLVVSYFFLHGLVQAGKSIIKR